MEKEDFHSAADLASSEQQRLTKGNNIIIGDSVSKPQPGTVAINLPSQALATSTPKAKAAASPQRVVASMSQAGSPGSRDYVGLAKQSPPRQQQQLQGPSRPSFFKQFYNFPTRGSNSSGSSNVPARDIEADDDDFSFGTTSTAGGNGSNSSGGGNGGGNNFKLTPRKTVVDKKTTEEELRPLSNGYVLQNS